MKFYFLDRMTNCKFTWIYLSACFTNTNFVGIEFLEIWGRFHKTFFSFFIFSWKNRFHKLPNGKLCLSGQTHQVDEVTFIGVKYIDGGAVSGNWWADDNRPSMVFEEFPPAYTLLDLYEDHSITYRNVFYKFSTWVNRIRLAGHVYRSGHNCDGGFSEW